jgi:hypothetical protein
VVDLRTEFGVNVGDDGKMRGRVFKGKLEAALLNAEGTHQRSFFLDAARATATKAFEIDSRQGHIEVIATSEDYAHASVPIAPPLPLDTGATLAPNMAPGLRGLVLVFAGN